ncbi:zinc finger and BTB domain-containing protein 43-like isoform X2 [Heptranchias perlo]|uniref:zinc finger and BTB domain-containing protein 43-like isoform X2 n=1 Tax=Heptranchias perlo TaxID=212740 RepID=UPI003559FA3C
MFFIPRNASWCQFCVRRCGENGPSKTRGRLYKVQLGLWKRHRPMEPGMFQVEFPNFGNNLLRKLNQQRMEGKLCDITIHLQGQMFKAHRAVLAASSPYFHDQVLLKNASRIVLPGVMSPKAFENVLASSYTGKLTILSPEIVSYLTVASFLQMWHVVDKCTELLQESQPAPSQPPASQNQSPSSSNYLSPWHGGEPGTGVPAKFERPEEDDIKMEGNHDEEEDEDEDEEEDEEGPKGQASPGRETEQDNVISNSAEREKFGGGGVNGDCEAGVSNSLDCPYPVPGYSQPSIVPHKRWVFVKTGGKADDVRSTGSEEGEPRFLQAAGKRGLGGAVVAAEEEEPGGNEGGHFAEHGLPEEYDEFTEDPSYDEPVDYYGSSDDFHFDRMGGPGGGGGGLSPPPDGIPPGDGLPGEIQENGAYGVLGEPGPSPGQLAAANSDFPGGVYKLYPCQCGKSFAHKSQRDRHMSMHLNVRPFGCPICNKKFKMKHHLMGHMKIHTGHKPYECHYCGKKFMWRDSFTRHRNACAKLYHAAAAAAPTPPGIIPDLDVPSDLNVPSDL